jgi:hypothetical protein
MIPYNLLFPIAFMLTITLSTAPEIKKSDVITQFNNIETTPQTISFTNNFDVNNTDGHLQGIQLCENAVGKYFILSGSSATYSYCPIVKLGVENKTATVNRLMEKPFKHAGGFQVYQDYLAIGIEDNSTKDKSKVCIYDISEPEAPLAQPFAVLERNGEPFRNTAGCVGMTDYKNKTLIVVGDWDSKNLDFYTMDLRQLNDPVFTKMGSIETEGISRKGWIDNSWHPYQNINLFNIDGDLFLIGLGQSKKSENIADLYLITEGPPYQFSLQKIATKMFDCTSGCSFKAGAGAHYANGKFRVYACGYNITSMNYLNIFQSE